VKTQKLFVKPFYPKYCFLQSIFLTPASIEHCKIILKYYWHSTFTY